MKEGKGGDSVVCVQKKGTEVEDAEYRKIKTGAESCGEQRWTASGEREQEKGQSEGMRSMRGAEVVSKRMEGEGLPHKVRHHQI